MVRPNTGQTPLTNVEVRAEIPAKTDVEATVKDYKSTTVVQAGEGSLLAKEAGVGHQTVQKHDRNPLALVAIGDTRAVRCREEIQSLLPVAALLPKQRPGRVPAPR